MDMVVDLTDDAAVDLSSHHVSTPAISMNGCNKSVDSPGKENLYENGDYSNLTHAERIHNLQCDLRNEETKLLLLRKIRSSQSVATSQANKAIPPSNLNGQARLVPYKTSPGGSTSGGGGSATGQRPGISSLLKPKSLMKSPLVGVAERIVNQHPTPARSIASMPPSQHQQQQQRPQVVNSAAANDSRMVAWMNQQRQINQSSQWSQQQQQQQQRSAPPPSLPPQKPPVPSAESIRLQLQQQQQQKQLLAKAAAVSEAQLLAQRQQAAQQAQANAKQTLRKQLEMTLLQIPPPKPPPPTLVLVPNATSSEFVVLLGLDECVRAAERKRNTGGEEKPWSHPPVCRQCGTDFTPVWTPAEETGGDKKGAGDCPEEGTSKVGGGRGFICEHCVTSNRKRALKQEHTNRLKSAFVKALQQEQAIELSMRIPESSVGRVTGVQQFKVAPNNAVQQIKSAHGGGQQSMRLNN